MLSLGLAEILVRCFLEVPTVGIIPLSRFRLSSNPLIAYEPVPLYGDGGKLEPDFSLRGGFNEQSNTLGFRDRDHSLQKPDGAKRILIIGDSISVGWAVPNYADTYVPQLEQLLLDAGNKVELVNFSVAGYNTGQEVELLKERGLAFHPDMVILQYCVNDSYDPWPANMHFAQTLLRRQQAAGLEFMNLGRYLNLSALYRIVKFRLLPVLLPAGSDQPYSYLAKDTVRASLQTLKAVADAQKFPVVIVFFPTAPQGKPGRSASEAGKLKRWAEDLKFSYIDLSSQLAVCAADSGVVQFLDEFHPSISGHSCAARALAPAVAEILGSDRH